MKLDKVTKLKNKIADKLQDFSKGVQFKNAIGLFDINNSAEEFYRGIFNIVFDDWDYENLNEKIRNNPGVDLGDEKKGIGIQVTSEQSPTKVHESMRKFVKYNIPEGYHELFVFMIKGKPDFPKADFSKNTRGKFEFDKHKHIIDNEYLLKPLRDAKIDKLEKAVAYLEKMEGKEEDSKEIIKNQNKIKADIGHIKETVNEIKRTSILESGVKRKEYFNEYEQQFLPDHLLEVNIDENNILTEHLFPAMLGGNVLLFLGPGILTNEIKPYFGDEIVKEFSEANKIYLEELDPADFVDFVDNVFADTSFNINDLDNFIFKYFNKRAHSEAYEKIVTIDWREIITTNFDIFLIKEYSKQKYRELIPVRNRDEYKYRTANNELKYISLNGTLQDKSKYPLVLSPKDYEKARPFYKRTLSGIRNLSHKVKLIFIGYHQADKYARFLLNKFEEFDFRRGGRWIYSLDPNIGKSRLPKLKQSRICVIKTNANQFFDLYEEWKKKNNKTAYSDRKITIYKDERSVIRVPAKKYANLDKYLRQISLDSQGENRVRAYDFYRGENPDIQVVRDDYDVIKRNILQKVIRKVYNEAINNNSNSIPLYVFSGSYGVGKSTFTFRLIYELLQIKEYDLVVFEVLDADKISFPSLVKLLKEVGCKNILFLFQDIEQDNKFKSMFRFQTGLNLESYFEFNLFIISSIRENIFEKYKTINQDRYKGKYETINIDIPFSKDEAEEFITKLETQQLVSYRDAFQKESFVKQICKDYKGDLLISLLSLIEGGKHQEIIKSTYNGLSNDGKSAFLFTSLLYRFKIKMPASLLRSILSMEWDTFIKDVLKYDSKGILIQEEDFTSSGTDPDIYFITKHSIISEQLVKAVLVNEEKRFKYYEKIVFHLNDSGKNVQMAIDLLKIFETQKEFSKEKIYKLFDKLSLNLGSNEHFVLHYAMSLQSRFTKEACQKAIEKIQEVEAQRPLFERNDKLTHRKGCLQFTLARIEHKNTKDFDRIALHVREARDFFDIKKQVDSNSVYSYVDYLKLELWYMDVFPLNKDEQLEQRVIIENLFSEAEGVESFHWIEEIRNDYQSKFIKDENYIVELEESYYNDTERRPYTIILMYYYYIKEANWKRCIELINELDVYKDIQLVAVTLFKHYGRNLHDANYRNKFFELTRNNESLKDKEKLRFSYYSYISEYYNGNYSYGDEHRNELKRTFRNLNPNEWEKWKDKNGDVEVFEGIVKKVHGRIKVRVIDLGRNFEIDRKSLIKNFSELNGNKYKVELVFYLFGIRANLIEEMN